MATRTLELSQQDEQDLELACLARITALCQLRDRTHDIEDRNKLIRTLDRMYALLKRLREL